MAECIISGRQGPKGDTGLPGPQGIAGPSGHPTITTWTPTDKSVYLHFKAKSINFDSLSYCRAVSNGMAYDEFYISF